MSRVTKGEWGPFASGSAFSRLRMDRTGILLNRPNGSSEVPPTGRIRSCSRLERQNRVPGRSEVDIAGRKTAGAIGLAARPTLLGGRAGHPAGPWPERGIRHCWPQRFFGVGLGFRGFWLVEVLTPSEDGNKTRYGGKGLVGGGYGGNLEGVRGLEGEGPPPFLGGVVLVGC
jgi:hypothetical protein